MAQLEVHIREKFSDEKHEFKRRFKNFNYFQNVSPDEFSMINEKNEIKFANNPYMKKMRLIAN